MVPSYSQDNIWAINNKNWYPISLPAETVHLIWLLPRLSMISCFLPKLLSAKNDFQLSLSVWFCFLPRAWIGSRIRRTDSAGSHLSCVTGLDGSKRSLTVSAEAKYDGQSQQEEMDGWMTCDFTSFFTVFQSYQDDVWMIMTGSVQWNSVYGWEDFTSSEDRTRSARSVGQRLTHWATGAPDKKRT